MKIYFISPKFIANNNNVFVMQIGYKHYCLGIQLNNWGIRIMLIATQICIHYK